MESRNVKIVDEHGIDRDANVICGLKVSGADYVLYSIERDGDNNNLFISKVMNNFDGTSNMINIEDTMEKTRLNDVVKELVTHAINNEANKVEGPVTLASGTVVEIMPLIFNKEQNINVGKTYVTTVKKSVTKVCGDFYDIPKAAPSSQESTFFDTVKDDIFDTNPAPVEAAPAMPEAVPSTEPTVVEPILPAAPVVETPVVEPTPMPAAPVEPILPAEPAMPAAAPVVAPIFDTATPVAPAAPVVEPTPAPMPAAPVEPILPTEPATNDLVFDGSKETNLNQALGEVSTANAVAVDDVNSLRDFGQSDVPSVDAVVPPVMDTTTVPPVTGASGGFANKKFFMVIAILFFVAACIFLGYEAFMYFQLTK